MMHQLNRWLGLRADLRYYHAFVDEKAGEGGYLEDYGFWDVSSVSRYNSRRSPGPIRGDWCSVLGVIKSAVGAMRWVIVAGLALGCANEIVVDDASGDAGADAGSCPDYMPDDAGVILLMRGCPLTIEYSFR